MNRGSKAWRSFRLRLFGLAALGACALLAGVFALVAAGQRRHEIERLDQRLCMEARRVAGMTPADIDDRQVADLMAKLRLSSRAQLRVTLPADTVSPATDAAPPPPPPPPPPAVGGPELACTLTAFEDADATWHAARAGPPGPPQLAVDLEAAEAEWRDAARELLRGALPLALVLAVVAAWGLSAVAMRPVHRLRDAMSRVTRQALDQRLDPTAFDREFDGVVGAFNGMLARLEASFHQASRFSADAAHELRTPLTVLQGRLEQALGECDGGPLEPRLAQMLEAVRRLSAITRQLLLLAQADAGRLAVGTGRVDVSALLEDLVADARALAPAQAWLSAIEPGASTAGDETLLQQLFNNLVGNAMRYTPAGGWVRVSVREANGGIEAVVANASPPLGPQLRQRLFDRFHRGEGAHVRAVEGAGLGLALAREIARAHGGELVLVPSEDDVVCLCVRLPKA
jgi:signal transduction histidine kinase